MHVGALGPFQAMPHPCVAHVCVNITYLPAQDTRLAESFAVQQAELEEKAAAVRKAAVQIESKLTRVEMLQKAKVGSGPNGWSFVHAELLWGGARWAAARQCVCSGPCCATCIVCWGGGRAWERGVGCTRQAVERAWEDAEREFVVRAAIELL